LQGKDGIPQMQNSSSYALAESFIGFASGVPLEMALIWAARKQGAA
jgi:hypothetical protein